ncbi:uncharacterized protein LOC128132410 [Lactuca sativa]|uniref:uncharacterized protein LOC128132410 n=1 Tax=Lactuca sativa TaxID=4236 RepID=UPI0022B06F78|nr:uncharacterized protein LOC128132410 [Lactuca sativa]
MLMLEEYCPRDEVEKLEHELWTLIMNGSNLAAYTTKLCDLSVLCPGMITLETKKRKDTYGDCQPKFKEFLNSSKKIKKNQKATSSKSHRVQDEPARITETVDRWVAEEKAVKMYETGQSSRPHLPHSSEDNTLSQLFEKSVKIEDKMEIVEGRATHLSERVRRLEGQRKRDQESVMDVHHRINFAYNDMITHDARIAELELYNKTSRNEERTGSLEQRTQALEEQVVKVTDVLGHHLGF